MTKFEESKEKEPEGIDFFSMNLKWASPFLLIPFAFWVGYILWAYYSAGRTPFFSLSLWAKFFPPIWKIQPLVFVEHLSHFLKLALFMGMAWGIGRALLLRLLRLDQLNPFEVFAFGYGLGIGVMGYLMLGLGALGLLRFPIVLGLSFLLCLLTFLLNRDLSIDRIKLREFGSFFFAGFWKVLSFSLVLFIFLLYGFYALAPEIFYDSLVYHLALPQLYQTEGRLVSTPTILYSGIPQLMEMLYTWALFMDDGILAKLIHWSTGIGFAVGLLGFSLRCRKPLMGWLTCAIFFSTPLVAMNQWKTGVDVGSTYMVLLSIYALALYLHEGKGALASRSLLILSAVNAGLAMGIKYTNWPLPAVLIVCFLLLRISLRTISIYTLIVLAIVAPWVIKNLWFYGNPIYPFFNELVNPQALYPVNWQGLMADAWSRNWGLILSGWRSILEVLAHPWFLTIKGKTDADFLGPLFLIGLPSLFLIRAASKESRFLLWALIGLWMTWWPINAMPRLFMPGLALLSIWIGHSVIVFKGPWLRSIMIVGLLSIALNNIFWVSVIGYNLEAWPFLIRGYDKSEYLRRSHPTYPNPYFSSAEWINTNSPSNARILVIGDARGFYLERSFIASSVFDTDPFLHWLRQSSSAIELAKMMKEKGITHLLINMGEVFRLKRTARLTIEKLKALEAFFEDFAIERFEDFNGDPRNLRWSLVFELIIEKKHHPEKENPLLKWYKQMALDEH